MKRNNRFNYNMYEELKNGNFDKPCDLWSLNWFGRGGFIDVTSRIFPIMLSPNLSGSAPVKILNQEGHPYIK